MAIIATRINNSGTYLVNGSFDEVTTSTIRVTTDTVYASLIDEVTYNSSSTFAKREGSTGIVYVTDQFDEFTGAPIVDSSLKLWLDAGQSSSYSGSGSTWTSLVSIVSTTTLTTTTYTSSIGGSIHFDGTNGYASLQVPSLNTTYCTVEMLCRFNALGARMPFGWTVYDVYTASNNIGYNTGASDLYGIPAATVSSLGILGNWKHFCFVMQNNIIYPAVPYTNNKIYVNGTNQTLVQILSTQSGTTRSFSNGIGKISGWATDFNYKAMMDLAVFNVYNRELTADEITQNFNALRRRYGI